MNPRLVTTGSANGVPIQVDLSGCLTASPVPVDVTLNGPYTLANPMPPGYPTIPSRTGASVASYPGQTFPAGTTLGLVQPEADALIAAGATTQFPGFSSISVPAGVNPTLTLDVSATLDTSSVPAASAFTVEDNGVALTVSGVTVAAGSISLALTGTIASGDAVTLTYAPPATNPVQSAAGVLMAPINGAMVEAT
ncbi:MAG: SwmB domain-containing protein [Steroidobacteraceae bacterium]